MTKTCEICGNEFEKKSWESAAYWAKKKFCSMSCYGRSKVGEKRPESHCKAISAGQFGHKRYKGWSDGSKSHLWKGGEVEKQCKQCGKQFQVRWYRRETANFCSRLCKTNNSDHGRTPANERARKSAAYRAWRTLVFERDNYTCQFCGKKAGYLHADHIKPFALHPSLRFDVGNGRTLCVPCHKRTGTYGGLTVYREAVA